MALSSISAVLERKSLSNVETSVVAATCSRNRLLRLLQATLQLKARFYNSRLVKTPFSYLAHEGSQTQRNLAIPTMTTPKVHESRPSLANAGLSLELRKLRRFNVSSRLTGNCTAASKLGERPVEMHGPVFQWISGAEQAFQYARHWSWHKSVNYETSAAVQDTVEAECCGKHRSSLFGFPANDTSRESS